jgi:hypothetical protein
MKRLVYVRHRSKRSQLHSMFRECEEKYCKEGDKLIMVTKMGGRPRNLAIVDGGLFKELLRAWKEMTKRTAP